jgi:hypothetical protein
VSPDTNPLSRHTSAVKQKSTMAPEEVTKRLNEVLDQLGDEIDENRAFLTAAARRLLKNVEWDLSPNDSCAVDTHRDGETERRDS